MRSFGSGWCSLVYDHGDGSRKGVHVPFVCKRPGVQTAQASAGVASTRSVASGRPERLTRPLPASRQQVSNYAGLSHNAQMAGTHYCYGAHLQQNLRDSSTQWMPVLRAAGCSGCACNTGRLVPSARVQGDSASIQCHGIVECRQAASFSGFWRSHPRRVSGTKKFFSLSISPPLSHRANGPTAYIPRKETPQKP